ncbi:MAG: hypothetical protein AUI14_20870 [Actinobacteria bacterium 13_2_20CM_2_71_6]|nr:MAG: hypothetical protein AUI14_20870 [Actinobacteria bacterium 13_2_20CM_2_71_6]
MSLRTYRAVLALVAMATTGCSALAGCSAKKAAPPAGVPSTAAQLGTVPANPSGGPGLGGTLFYLERGQSGAPTVLHAVMGTTVRSLANLPGPAYLTINVSPDGRRLAWVDAGPNNVGTLYVTNVDGSGKRALGDADDAGACVEPVWSPDSRRLLVSMGGKLGLLDLDTGTFGPTRLGGCHLLWSAKKMSFGDGSGHVWLVNPDGSEPQVVPKLGGTPGGPRSLDFESLSPDGARIILDLHTGDTPDGDAARGLDANTVIDTRTGEKVAMPPFQQALFLPDGNVLLRNAGKLTVVSPAGQTVREATEPAAAKDWTLLSYTPAS